MRIEISKHNPNGGAYEAKEARIGPPLLYISEKLKMSLTFQHSLLHSIQDHVPDDLAAVNEICELEGLSTKGDFLLKPSFIALDQGIVAFAALHNMLGHVPTNSSQFEKMSPESFRSWLAFISDKGSVTGPVKVVE